MTTRRQVLALAGALVLAPSARAQEDQEFPLLADDGAPLRNYRVPVELDPATLPGVIWRGPRSADVVLYEFFDYNCSFCRKAAGELDAILSSDSRLRLGLVNNAILSIGSAQAAKVQQGVLRLHGPGAAYDFHTRMFARRGQGDGASALAVAREMGLDPDKIEESGDSPAVSGVLTRQARLAEALGMAITPSFVIASVALLGWPGVTAMRKVIASVRKCGSPVCGA
jgi:protein-disulfide isomerase